MTLLAVPPVLPMLVEDLGLSPTLIGALSGSPVLLLSVGAAGGSFMIARLGARRALVFGLLVVASGSALRGVGASVPVLFSMSWLMAIGIALMQPAMPSVTRNWCPAHVGMATAVYANGLLVGEILPVALTIPVILPLLNGSWSWSLVFWSLPALLTAVAILIATQDERGTTAAPGVRSAWWPDLRNGLTWKAGLAIGMSGSVYFGTNGFVPELLRAREANDLIGPSLTALNVGQLPSSIILLLFARQLCLRRLPVVVAVLACGCGLTGIVFLSGYWVVAASALVGGGTAFILIWSISLPAMIAPSDQVSRVSAGIFTIGYFLAFLFPLIGGVIWEATQIPETSLAPMGVMMLVALAAILMLRTPDKAATPERGSLPPG